MKKVLSLVMSLALTLSLVSVALAAPVASTTTKASTTTTTSTTTFTDESSITNADAVTLLAKLGILSGYEDGSYQPAKTVTRAEAAKIVCYLLLGEDAASSLADAAVTTGFTDVDGQGYDWATGFIQYAANNGIISGYGDGTFGPGNNVTTYQLAKMILCGLGYGVNGEYTGTYWATNVAVQAVKLGILEKGAANEDCSRDMTALAAYNSLFVYLVTWSSDDNKYNTVTETDKNDSDKEIKQTLAIQNYDYQTAMGVLKNDGDDDGYYIDVTNTDEVSEDYVYVDCTDPTLLGLNVEAGCIDDQGITAPTAIDKTLGTTIKGNVSDWFDNNEDDYIADLASDEGDTITLIYNGEVVKTYTIADATDASSLEYTVSDLEALMETSTYGYFKDGKIVKAIDTGVLSTDTDADDEDYSFDGDIDVFVVVDKYVSLIDDGGVTVDDGEVTIDGATAKLSDGSTEALTDIDSDDIVYPSDLAAGDVVLSYQDDASGIYYVTKATSVTGTISAVAVKNSSVYHYTISSTKYAETGLDGDIDDNNLSNGSSTCAVATGDEVTAYLDDGGNVVYLDTDSTGSSDYAAVVKAVWVDSSSADAYLSLKLLFSDGTTDVVTIDQVDGEDAVENDANDVTATTAGLLNSIVTYNVNSDGTYDVTPVDDTKKDIDVEDIDSDSSAITLNTVNKTYYADSDTVFFLCDDDDNYSSTDTTTISGDDYSAYTGYKNVADVTGIDYGYVVYDGTGAAYVYLMGDVGGTTADNYYFLLDSESNDNDDYYTYSAAMDSSKSADLKTENELSGSDDVAGYVYSVDSLTSDGYAKSVTQEAWTAGIDLVSNGTLVVGTTTESSYSYDSDTVVYRVTYNADKDKYTATVGSVSSYVKEGVDDLIYVVTGDDSDDDYATEIFVLEDCAPSLTFSYTNSDSDSTEVESVGLSATTVDVDDLKVGTEQTITFTVPDDASVKVSEASDNSNLCTVNTAGTKATISSSVANGNTVTLTVVVTSAVGTKVTYTVNLTAAT